MTVLRALRQGGGEGVCREAERKGKSGDGKHGVPFIVWMALLVIAPYVKVKFK